MLQPHKYMNKSKFVKIQTIESQFSLLCCAGMIYEQTTIRSHITKESNAS
jgi:hypothetical protein